MTSDKNDSNNTIVFLPTQVHCNPPAMNTPVPEEHRIPNTLFYSRAKEIESQKIVSKQGATQLGLWLFVPGLILTVLSPIFYFEGLQFLASANVSLFAMLVTTARMFPEFNLILILLISCTGICLAVPGAKYLIRAAAEPVKCITCPACGEARSVFRSITSLMCACCGRLMLLGNSTESALIPDVCAYCGLETYITSDHGAFCCSNCGIERGPSAVLNLTVACPKCGNFVPDRALYCVQCSEILDSSSACAKRGRNVDMHWEIGKDAKGHLNYARGILHNIDVQIPKCKQLVQFVPLYEDLTRALVSLEQCLEDRCMHSQAHREMQATDRVYCNLLVRELDLIVSSKNNRSIALFAPTNLLDEPHLAPHFRIERILGNNMPKAEPIQFWQHRLVSIAHGKVLNYSRLQNEVERLRSGPV